MSFLIALSLVGMLRSAIILQLRGIDLYSVAEVDERDRVTELFSGNDLSYELMVLLVSMRLVYGYIFGLS